MKELHLTVLSCYNLFVQYYYPPKIQLIKIFKKSRSSLVTDNPFGRGRIAGYKN